MVENPNFAPLKKLIEDTGKAKQKGKKYEPTKQEVTEKFSTRKKTTTSDTSKSRTKSTKKTGTSTTTKSITVRQDTPPIPKGSLYESEAYESHTSVIGIPATRPGESGKPVETPLPQTGGAEAPPYSRSGGTATPSELQEVDHSRSSSGIVTDTLHDQEERREQQQLSADRANRIAQERTQTEVIQPQQQRLQQEGQDIAQQRYNELMDARAAQLGISKDPETGQYIVENPNQWRLLMAYSGIAREKANEEARQHVVQRQRDMKDSTQERTLDIYQQEYAKEGMVVVQDPETGKYQVMTREAYQRKQLRMGLEEEYQQKPLPERAALIAAETFLNIGNVGMWIDTITKGPAAGYEHLMDYRTEIALRRYENDPVGALLATPTFTNIALPLAIGLGVGYASPKIVAAAYGKSQTFGKITEKSLQIGGRAMLGTYAGLEIGMTAVAGITQGPEAALKRGGEAALRFGFAYAGARIGGGAEPFKTSVRKKTTEFVYYKDTGDITAQRVINLFGKKIVWYKSPVTMKTRNILDVAGKPSTATDYNPFYGQSRWFTTTTSAWQPKTGIPLPGVYSKFQPSVWVAPKPTTVKPMFGGVSGLPAVFDPIRFDSLTESQSQFISNLYSKQLAGKKPVTISDAYTAYQKKWGLDKFKPDGPRQMKGGKEPWRPTYKIDVDPETGISEIKRGKDIFYQPKKTPQKDTGVFWKTGRELSTKVLSKPVLYRAYQTRFIVVDWTPLFKQLIIGRMVGKPKTTTVKPKPKIYTMKDIIKTDPISGTPTGTGRQQTILKTKVQTKTIQKQQLQQKTMMVTEKQYLETMLQQKAVSDVISPKLMTSKRLAIYTATAPSMLQQKRQAKEVGLGSLFADAQTDAQMQGILFGQTQTQGQTQQKNIAQIQNKGIGTIVPPKTITIQTTPPSPFNIFFKGNIIPPEPNIPGIKIKPVEPKMGMIGIQKMENTFGIGGEQAYYAMVKKRQYVGGRRVRGTEWVKASPHAYRREDALAVGSHVVDNSAKRTVKLVPADKKPRKRPAHINAWGEQMFEYRRKNNDVYVETNMFAIDSPGEVNEISRRGWEARRKKGSKTRSSKRKGGVSTEIPGLKGITKRISKRMMR